MVLNRAMVKEVQEAKEQDFVSLKNGDLLVKMHLLNRYKKKNIYLKYKKQYGNRKMREHHEMF